jgi:thioredoxin 1
MFMLRNCLIAGACVALSINAWGQTPSPKVPRLTPVSAKLVSVGPKDGVSTVPKSGGISLDFEDFKNSPAKTAVSATPAPGSGEAGLAGDNALRALLSKLGAPADAAGVAGGGAGIQELSSASFDQAVLQSPKPVVVTFHATWCGPCKRFAPTVKSAAAKMTDVTFARVDIDQCEAIAKRYNVSGVPTVILFKGGQPVDRFVGGTNLAGIEKLVSAAR